VKKCVSERDTSGGGAGGGGEVGGGDAGGGDGGGGMVRVGREVGSKGLRGERQKRGGSTARWENGEGDTVIKRKEKGKVQHGGGRCGRRNERGENY
jgi:hypothetical protein